MLSARHMRRCVSDLSFRPVNKLRSPLADHVLLLAQPFRYSQPTQMVRRRLPLRARSADSGGDSTDWSNRNQTPERQGVKTEGTQAEGGEGTFCKYLVTTAAFCGIYVVPAAIL